jgi:predicted  nucleic acid-binding Zn-ribbon protein
MRIARFLRLLLAVLTASVLLAPTAGAEPPFRLGSYVTDQANVLSTSQLVEVRTAVDNLYSARRVRLWVVYVQTFSNQDSDTWTRNTMRISNFQNEDAILAVATTDRAYSFLVPNAARGGVNVDTLRRNDIEPKLRNGDWAGAAVAAATGLNPTTAPVEVPWAGVAIFIAIIALLLVALLWWRRRRQHRRREAEFAAAKRLDASDPSALASVSLDTLDDLSKSMVVDVDNAVRTSDNELALAIEEFGDQDTGPFTTAVTNAKTTLAQAFNVRQILDDAVPETPTERRDLLTRVVVAAAKADRELDAQREAFQQLRDLVINAPTRLDNLTQQMVDLTARIEPTQKTLTSLHTQYADSALAPVAGNVDTAKHRLAFADQNITNGRTLISRPTDRQRGLVDAIHAAESALGQARTMLDAVDSAATDINRAIDGLPAAITDIQAGITHAAAQLAQGNVSRAADLSAARDAAVKAVSAAQATGSADPLGAFTHLTQADAELDRLLDAVTEERAAADRLGRAFDQALFSAQSRVKAVSDYIDTRRGSIGPEARTRLNEALRQLEAAQSKRATNPAEAIQHANGAAMLAGQAQSIANSDVISSQRAYTGRYGGGGGGNNMGAVLGGIIIGNILGGGLGGGLGGSAGGGWSPTSFGGSGGGYSGGGGRF